MFATTLALVLAMSTPQVTDLPFDSTRLEPAGSWPFGDGTTIVMDTTRHLVCVAAGCGVLVVDVADPVRPVVLSDRIRCQSQVWNMWLDGSRLYLAMATYLFVPSVERDIEVWDIGDATSPVMLSSLDLSACTAVWARDSLMLVSCWGRFLSYDVTDPRYPTLLDSVDAPTVAYRIEVRDTFAFLSVGLNGVQVFSVADPRNLMWLAGWGDNNVKEPGMAIDGNLLYQVATFDGHSSFCGMRIYDISDPLHGQLLGAFDTAYSSPNRLVIRDTIVAVAYRGAGLKLVSVADPAHPYEIAVAGGGCRDVVWHGSLAYVAGWSKLEIVDLADPSWPVVVASLTTRQAGSDVALARDAVLSLGQGLTVLGDDPSGELEFLGRLDTPVVSSPLSAFDTVAVAPIDLGDSFAVVGVSDPARPSVLSKAQGDCPMLVDTLCYAVADSVFRVYSLADPRDPVLLGSVAGSFWSGRINVAGDLALVGTYEVSVFDVSSPTRPLWLMDTAWLASCVAVQDTFAYTTSVRFDTLRIYSIASGLHMRELGTLRLPYSIEPNPGAITVRDTFLVVGGETWLAVYSVAEPAQPRCLYQSQTPFPSYSALLLSHDTLYAALGNRGLFRYRLYSESSGLELEPIGGVEVRPLRVWPSVARSVLNLAGRDEVALFDATGRRVLRLKSGANDVRALAPGVYFARDEKGRTSAKVTITR